ncbi:MAG: hypothetical protein MJ070_06425 [Lachnospiraceae bacterium]|nr:hypothetical protein [Lachnospiraceae bacterium]
MAFIDSFFRERKRSTERKLFWLFFSEEKEPCRKRDRTLPQAASAEVALQLPGAALTILFSKTSF